MKKDKKFFKKICEKKKNKNFLENNLNFFL
jgi:hypothetical protein